MRKLTVALLVGGSASWPAWAGCGDDETGGATPASSVAATGGAAGAGGTAAIATSSSAGGAGGGAATFLCNPVTNEGCAAGEACDLSSRGQFRCYAPPNEQSICSACAPLDGPWCQGTLTCAADGLCRRYCCDDGDCGPTLSCDTMVLDGISEVGLCMGVVGSGGAGASGGAAGVGVGGAGGSGGAGPGGLGGSGGTSAGGSDGMPPLTGPGCDDVPAMAPSNGSCVTIGE